MLPANLDLTRKSAEDALGVFARRQHEEDWVLDQLPASLDGRQQVEVKEGCYELLLVLADAVASQDPGQVDRALGILASGDRLRPEHSLRLPPEESVVPGAEGRSGWGGPGKLAERSASAPRPRSITSSAGNRSTSAIGCPRRSRISRPPFGMKPDHFWAKCLLAICYIQTARFEGAKSCLDACLQTDPEFAWLYLLRGFASGQLVAKYLGLVKASPGREVPLKSAADFEFEEAEADLREAMERLRRTPDDELRYVLLVNRGLIRFQRGRLDEAAADYQEAIRSKKDPFLAHAELAHVYQKRDKPAEAVEQLTRAIALKPDWSPLYRGRAEVLARGDASPRIARRPCPT